MILAQPDEEEEEEGRWGLVWDPEEGPVWGSIGGAEEEKQDDTWTQLLREGVGGITTDRDGEDTNLFVDLSVPVRNKCFAKEKTG